MTEVDFLNKIKEELSTLSYGEGYSFNIHFLYEMINKRIVNIKSNEIIEAKK